MQERKGMLSREHGMSKGGGVWKPVEGGGAEWNNVEPAGELGVGSFHALSSRSLFPPWLGLFPLVLLGPRVTCAVGSLWPEEVTAPHLSSLSSLQRSPSACKEKPWW